MSWTCIRSWAIRATAATYAAVVPIANAILWNLHISRSAPKPRWAG